MRVDLIRGEYGMENEDFVVEDKSLAGVPLMSSNASKIILELFSKKNQWVRKNLVREVERLHKSRGGVNGTQDSFSVVKKELTRLKGKNLIEQTPSVFGTWRRTEKFPADQGVDFTLDDQKEPAMIIEKTIGSGDEFVYVYYAPAYRELATLKRLEVWPCKIGRTIASITDRIYDQGIKTAFPEDPIIGLVIRTTDSMTLESTIHDALEACDCDIEDCPGTEWFNTSPERIEKWYAAYMSSFEILKHTSE